MTRLDLTRFSWAQTVLRNRWPQFLLRAVTLAGFVFTILAGLIGTVVGSHNFSIIFVWIAWWTALKLFFIPFGGRSFCSYLCPIGGFTGLYAQAGPIEVSGAGTPLALDSQPLYLKLGIAIDSPEPAETIPATLAYANRGAQFARLLPAYAVNRDTYLSTSPAKLWMRLPGSGSSRQPTRH
jgi:hypothetical protein